MENKDEQKKHSLEDQVTTVKLFYDLFDMISHTTAFTAGPSVDTLGEAYRQYCEEQGLQQMSADELWFELHSKLYPK